MSFGHRSNCRKGIGQVYFAINSAFAEGGKGAEAFATKVVQAIQEKPSEQLTFTYSDNDSIQEKIIRVAKNIYGASDVWFSKKAEKTAQKLSGLPISEYPVCIAKTQYSFSSNPDLLGAPTNFSIEIKDIILNNGAEFIVAIAGDILRMPGLPKNSQASHIDIVDGKIEGLS